MICPKNIIFFPTVSVEVVRFSSITFILLLLLLLSSSPLLPLLRFLLCFISSAVQLTVPIGDDGQLMSNRWPVLWLSTNAVQLTVPIGDDGQLMSGPLARPMA